MATSPHQLNLLPPCQVHWGLQAILPKKPTWLRSCILPGSVACLLWELGSASHCLRGLLLGCKQAC